MQIRKKITVLLFGLLPLMASAGQPFTLKECLDFAVENNRKLQKDKLGFRHRSWSARNSSVLSFHR